MGQLAPGNIARTDPEGVKEHIYYRRPRGPMDKASAYGAEDCRFDPCRGRLLFMSSFIIR